MSEAEAEADPVFEALWTRCLEAWDDDKPHAALLEHALKNEALPSLAGRYRALIDDPEKGPRAKKKMDALVIAATQMLMAMKTPAPTKTPWHWNVTAFAIFAIVSAWLLYTMFMRRH